MKQRSLKFWTVFAVAVIVAAQAVLFAFDVIPAGDGEVLDNGHVPGFVYAVLAVAFWGAVLALVALGVIALRRRRVASARPGSPPRS